MWEIFLQNNSQEWRERDTDRSINRQRDRLEKTPCYFNVGKKPRNKVIVQGWGNRETGVRAMGLWATMEKGLRTALGGGGGSSWEKQS